MKLSLITLTVTCAAMLATISIANAQDPAAKDSSGNAVVLETPFPSRPRNLRLLAAETLIYARAWSAFHDPDPGSQTD
jgi:hypothetical protein